MKKSEESEPLTYYQCIEILNDKISTNVKQICHDEQRLKWHDEDIEKLQHLTSAYGSLLIINYALLILFLIIMIMKG